ncbi:transposase family protein [Escherichia coli]|uniref:transposase family protein n=1 Tax=Escherichia coli TaxID=562 RepID=UPI0038601E17
MEHISIIPDYRQTWKVEHKLSDILLLTICAVISGAEGWEDIEDFGETHLDLTCWILKEKSSQLMRWVARKILQRRYKNREVIIYSR